MQPVRVVNLSPERIRYEEEQKRLVEIDETLQRLAQKAEVLQVVKILISKDPASIPCLSENLKSKYPDFPSTLSSQALEIAIKRVEADQNHLLQERAFIMAPLTELPEDLLKHITDLASPEEKATLSQVSRSWNKRSVASLQHEYDRFIQHKICQYIEALAPDATKPPFHSSPSTLAAVRADLEHIMDDHCSMGVQSLKNLRERVFELRNRARVALSHLDPADFQRIPSTPAPIGITRSDRYNLLPDLPFDAFYLMQDLLLCYDPAGEIDETIRFKTAGRLIKQGDVVTAREVARNVVTNESLIQETFSLLVGAGDIDGALALVDRFHQSYNKDLALLSIAMSIAKRGVVA